VKARILLPDGLYERAPKTGAPFNAQEALMKLALERIAEPARIAKEPVPQAVNATD